MAATQPQPKPRPVNQKVRFWIVRLALLACVPLILFSGSAWAGHPVVAPGLRVSGTLLVVAAVLYRFWAILYIGGRKNRAVVHDGPYSMSRHPLYFGTTLGAFGFGLLMGSLVLALVLGVLALVILTATAAREERFLRAEFGPAYDEFSIRVPNRILPKLSLFHTEAEVTFKPRILRNNVLDALGFLIVLPLSELLESLKSAGYLARFLIY